MIRNIHSAHTDSNRIRVFLTAAGWRTNNPRTGVRPAAAADIAAAPKPTTMILMVRVDGGHHG